MEVTAIHNIKLFLCCHNGYGILPPLFQPIQCGAALAPNIKGAIYDNAGDNISAKNREYCELTAHYFAWKNIEADYYGFCHYRRFFCYDESVKKPYLALKEINNSKLLGDEPCWRRLIGEYEIIAPRSEDMGISVKEYYCTSAYHYVEDMELFLYILSEKAPQLAAATDKYLSQDRQYFCNMFIMDKAHFSEYCEILFTVLEQFDRSKTLHGSFQSDRTNGYLGEVFTGIYLTYCRDSGAKIKELPRLDIGCSVKKRLFFALLPPESKRRFLAKRLAKKLRG